MPTTPETRPAHVADIPTFAVPSKTQRSDTRWRQAVIAGLSLAFAFVGQPSATAGEYLLGPQDKVRLKIYEWRASRDVFFEWTALNDQFTVGAGGALSLPFAGDIKAAGVTASDLGRAIGDRLMRQMGLGRQPDVAVEVVQYRPFYIVGHVKQPGEFSYRPDLTVLQALSIAGGLRSQEENASRLEREVITGRGEVRVIALSTVSLLVRKARLEAELAGLDKIEFPEQLAKRRSEATIALMMEQESSILEVRRDALNTQVRALSDLKEFLQKELSSLEAQLALHDKQIELVQKELGGVSSLVTKGYVAAPRELSLQRTLAEIQGGRLAAETSLLRARQEISRTDMSILELRNTHTNEVTLSLRETQTQLEELNRKSDTAVQLLHDSELTAPRLLALRAGREKAEPIYTIVRPSGSDMVQMPATESTAVEPGDTIKVEIPMPADLEGFDETTGLSLSAGSKEVSVAPEQATGIQ